MNDARIKHNLNGYLERKSQIFLRISAGVERTPLARETTLFGAMGVLGSAVTPAEIRWTKTGFHPVRIYTR
jgi:hypothetical protein